MHKLIAPALCLLTAAVLYGCGSEKYKVDYDGHKGVWTNAKDYYNAGQTVNVWMEDYALDVDYDFYLDGEPISAHFDERGYVLSFEMPPHDVKLTYETVNSMLYQPSTFDVLRDSAQLASFSDIQNKNGEVSGIIYRIYSNDGGEWWLEAENIGVSRELYKAGDGLLKDMIKIIDENQIFSWNETYEETPYQKEDGYRYMDVVIDDEGRKISADVSRMPENGIEVFEQFTKLFKEYMQKAEYVNGEYFGEE